MKNKNLLQLSSTIFLLFMLVLLISNCGSDNRITTVPSINPTSTSIPQILPTPDSSSSLVNISGRVFENNGFLPIGGSFITFKNDAVALSDSVDTFDASAISDQDGNYAFYNLPLGTCTIKFWGSENEYNKNRNTPLGSLSVCLKETHTDINLIAGVIQPDPPCPDTTPTPMPGISDDYTFVKKWTIALEGDTKESWPVKVAIDSSDNIYVVDNHNHRILKFSSNGSYITHWGQEGQGDGEFYYPYGISADSNFIYVSDTDNHRIQKFDLNGNFTQTWGTEAIPGEINNYRFSYPHGITVEPSGDIYVLDSDHHHVHEFTGDGQFVGIYGEFGTGDGQYHLPTDITADKSGYIYVADYGNYRVQKLDYDGNFIDKWGTYGNADGQFISPYAITVDLEGCVYVTDTVSHIVQKFTSDGEFVAKWGSSGSYDGQFFYPTGIAVDSLGNVYVADSIRKDIQVFAPVK